MARKAKENPTNMAEEDVAETLRDASGELIEAQDGLEAARAPIKKAKAAVKASGIDFDIFNICHGIRHLDDDGKRQNRINKLRVAIHALLGDKVELDLFGFVAMSVRPAVKEALKKASDDIAKAEPPAPPPEFDGMGMGASEGDEDADDDAEAAPEISETEPGADDPPPLAVAEDMPEGAGFAFNNGMSSGRKGHGPDGNPHDPESVEFGLWERGRAAGENWAARFYAEGSDLKCGDAGGTVVFTDPIGIDDELLPRCAAALNSAQAASDELLPAATVRDFVRANLGDCSIIWGSAFEPSVDALAPANASPDAAPQKVKFTGSAKQQRIQAYFFGFDGAAAGTPIDILTKGRRGEPKAQIEAGYRDQQTGAEPKHERPIAVATEPDTVHVEGHDPAADAANAGAEPAEVVGALEQKAADVPDAADHDAADSDDTGADGEPAVNGEPTAEDQPKADDAEPIARVQVREVGGKWVLWDAADDQALIDVNGPKTGETWANQMIAHFGDRLPTATRTELINAARTLWSGRLLTAPMSAPSMSANIFAAI